MRDDAPLLESLTNFVESVVRDSPRNRLALIDGSHIFDAPLIGVADGDDPLFEQYRHIIGPHHHTPRDILARAGIENATDATSTVRVFCWVLPISEPTKRSNSAMTRKPSQRWAHTRHYGELFNNELRAEVERYVKHRGGNAVAPVTSTDFRVVQDIPDEPSSTWSERHALYAAGLGTFGLCDGFLTPVGKAMRCGSVVVDLPLPVTERVHTSHTAACTYLSRGSCGDCISRCPAGAIGPSGHDKKACENYLLEILSAVADVYDVSIAGCGLCQTAVSCESGLPR